MRKYEEAVSPVVGVMLMLVITIIIAAVVSGFAGQLTGNAKSAPSVTMDISIKNSGLEATSAFVANVLSVSDPIPTKDLKMTTVWTKGGKTHTTVSDGSFNVFGLDGRKYAR
ncbi:MAG: type IV pilin N-terminal domain-containing protein [Methanomicrobium sp.]|nr:type IV pilin N-terminal domain-containing protein [Methanomicrobium sp.]